MKTRQNTGSYSRLGCSDPLNGWLKRLPQKQIPSSKILSLLLLSLALLVGCGYDKKASLDAPETFDKILDDPELVAQPQILGTFQGDVFNGGGMDRVLTNFRKNADGKISGTYVISEENGHEAGTLSKFKREGPYTLKCEWKDKYGTGTLRILFSSQYKLFRGFWGEAEGDTSLPWNGVKRE